MKKEDADLIHPQLWDYLKAIEEFGDRDRLDTLREFGWFAEWLHIAGSKP